MRLQGELNVPGAPGVRYQTNPGTGAPVGYTQQPTSFIGLPGGIGNQGAIAHGQHTTDSFVDGVPRYFPGSHDPRQHNELRDPAGNPIPGTAPPDSEIPLGYETNQSSNLPTSITQSSTAFPVGNNQGLVANVEAGPVLPGEGRKVWPRDGSAPGRGGIEIAHGKHTPDEVIDGVPRFWHPGSHNPVQHNEMRDPAGRPIPGTAPKDSDIPLAQGSAFPDQTYNMGYQIAQTPQGIGQPKQGQVQNLLNPLDWFSGRNQQTTGEVKEGTYQGGQGGGIDRMLKRTSDLNRLMNEM